MTPSGETTTQSTIPSSSANVSPINQTTTPGHISLPNKLPANLAQALIIDQKTLKLGQTYGPWTLSDYAVEQKNQPPLPISDDDAGLLTLTFSGSLTLNGIFMHDDESTDILFYPNELDTYQLPIFPYGFNTNPTQTTFPQDPRNAIVLLGAIVKELAGQSGIAKITINSYKIIPEGIEPEPDEVNVTQITSQSTLDKMEEQALVLSTTDDFLKALISRDATTVLNAFSLPSNMTEQDDYNSLAGFDIGSPRLFNARANGGLWQAKNYRITQIKTPYDFTIERELQLVIDISDYDDNQGWQTTTQKPFTLELRRFSDGWKVESFYRSDQPLKYEHQKYDQQFNG